MSEIKGTENFSNRLTVLGTSVALVTDVITSFPEFEFYADQLDNPVNADWAVNALAPAAQDTNNNGLTVRLFAAATEEGVGFILEIPSAASNIILGFKSRAETAPGSVVTVGLSLYERGVPDNGAVDAWSASNILTDISLPLNENFQYDEQTLATSTLGLTAGQVHQFELTRVDPAGGAELTGDWALLPIKVSFS